MDRQRETERRKKRKHELLLITPPPDWREYFDHYLGRRACLVDHWHALLSLEQLFPCHLVFAALCVRARRLRQLPPPPRYMHVHFPALQLQRFLRGFVFATAHALVTPRASALKLRLAHARTESRCVDRIFVRVMRGFVKRAKVRSLGEHCSFHAHAMPLYICILFDHH